MKTIISKEVMNQVWEIGNNRVIELEKLINEYPILTRLIREIKKDYIVCLNAISSRDFNLIEQMRKIIDTKEIELEEQVKEIDEDTHRSKRAKQSKNKECEEIKDGE